MEYPQKIRNLSLCRKIFERCYYDQNFTPAVVEMLSNIQFFIKLRAFFQNGRFFLKMFPGYFLYILKHIRLFFIYPFTPDVQIDSS